MLSNYLYLEVQSIIAQYLADKAHMELTMASSHLLRNRSQTRNMSVRTSDGTTVPIYQHLANKQTQLMA